MHMVWRRIDRWGGSSVEGEDRGCRHMSASSVVEPGPKLLASGIGAPFFLDIPRNSRNIGEFPLSTECLCVGINCLNS